VISRSEPGLFGEVTGKKGFQESPAFRSESPRGPRARNRALEGTWLTHWIRSNRLANFLILAVETLILLTFFALLAWEPDFLQDSLVLEVGLALSFFLLTRLRRPFT